MERAEPKQRLGRKIKVEYSQATAHLRLRLFRLKIKRQVLDINLFWYFPEGARLARPCFLHNCFLPTRFRTFF